MATAMLLGSLRRCEVLGLRLTDINAGERRVFVAEGKGGNQRTVPVTPSPKVVVPSVSKGSISRRSWPCHSWT